MILLLSDIYFQTSMGKVIDWLKFYRKKNHYQPTK